MRIYLRKKANFIPDVRRCVFTKTLFRFKAPNVDRIKSVEQLTYWEIDLLTYWAENIWSWLLNMCHLVCFIKFSSFSRLQIPVIIINMFFRVKVVETAEERVDCWLIRVSFQHLVSAWKPISDPQTLRKVFSWKTVPRFPFQCCEYLNQSI